MGSLLACVLSLRATGARSVLDRAPAGLARGNQLAAYPADVGVLPVDRSRQRMASTSAMVRAERDGGSSRRGLFTGIEERAVSLPGQGAATQERVVQPPAAALAGSVRRQLRCSALRLDEHLLRGDPAG